NTDGTRQKEKRTQFGRPTVELVSHWSASAGGRHFCAPGWLGSSPAGAKATGNEFCSVWRAACGSPGARETARHAGAQLTASAHNYLGVSKESGRQANLSSAMAAGGDFRHRRVAGDADHSNRQQGGAASVRSAGPRRICVCRKGAAAEDWRF